MAQSRHPTPKTHRSEGRTALTEKLLVYGPVAALAVVTWLCIVTRLDPGGNYPAMPQGPGLTVDEFFNVQQGVYLVEQSRALGWLNLVPGTSHEAFRVSNGYNPDHPPLGRWWLGLHHHVAWWLFPPFEPDGPWVTACARTGSATAYALTILAVGWFVTSRSGTIAGLFTAASLALMPRVFGHAHLASLESITNLTCTLSVLVLAQWWNGSDVPTSRSAVCAGLLFGLALITKIQAVLIPVPFVCWVLWRWRVQGLRPLAIWSVTAIAAFYLLWPYLWDAPLAHGLEYLGRTTNRATIYVWYWGHRFVDKQVPWHYPFVLFGLTVPVSLHLLGLVGAYHAFRNGWGKRRCTSNSDVKQQAIGPKPDHAAVRVEDLTCWAGDVLVILCAVFPLVVFALPGIAVYDGERLFLTSYPLWAVLIGNGASILWQKLLQRTGRYWIATVACSSLFVASAWPLIAASPCYLSYYNELDSLVDNSVDRSMFEADYWGEGITRELLTELTKSAPHGATVAIAPALHQFQTDEYLRQSPILRSHDLKVIGYDSNDKATKCVLVYRRLADLPDEFRGDLPDRIQASTMVRGRRLAYLFKRGS